MEASGEATHQGHPELATVAHPALRRSGRRGVGTGDCRPEVTMLRIPTFLLVGSWLSFQRLEASQRVRVSLKFQPTGEPKPGATRVFESASSSSGKRVSWA